MEFHHLEVFSLYANPKLINCSISFILIGTLIYVNQVFFSVMAGAFSVGNALPFINSVSIAIGAASNLFDIIDSKPNIDPYSSQGKKINKLQGKIEFKNVNFTYPSRSTSSVS